MLIHLGYELEFETPTSLPVIALLCVHPSRATDLRTPDELRVDPEVPIEPFIDSYGNLACRFIQGPGSFRVWNTTLIEDPGDPDPVNLSARQLPVEELPSETLRYLLASRYCEVDLMFGIAAELFGDTAPGWPRVQAICDWVQSRVKFGYNFARSTRTALETYTERVGVCRDFQHLAVTFCRCLNIPARYATGYLGDIGVPPAPYPMDFSAWFEVFLEDRWWIFDARHNTPRIGRVLVAVGRDAADVAITTTFGNSRLTRFEIITEQWATAEESSPQATVAASVP